MQSDPRVFFASERTLLAWLRTGIAIVGLGFVVSRFGLFLRVIALQSSPSSASTAPHGYSQVIGILLVVLGSMCMAGASVQHGRFIATLPEHDRPTHYSRVWALWIGGMVTLSSVLLAGYLVVSSGAA
jgi:putative membrane protein